jgi:hypothetical protein|tara:strand:- start:303 stop:542 length:240 start_codon:yes stop_codon:yes gene_type:complete
MKLSFIDGLSHTEDQKEIKQIHSFFESGLMKESEWEKKLTNVALRRSHIKQQQNLQELVGRMWKDLYKEQQKDYKRMGL